MHLKSKSSRLYMTYSKFNVYYNDQAMYSHTHTATAKKNDNFKHTNVNYKRSTNIMRSNFFSNRYNNTLNIDLHNIWPMKKNGINLANIMIIMIFMKPIESRMNYQTARSSSSSNI